ncbi:hypothetical protein HanHA300_Chr17g0653711 [Helianthus annuus]|nr:hypothetical protein HanHA300_Chr17g0653711 [Helianthus annuus]KAJ0447473.1 hypothetical protein HanHA89_Chr17g0705801 [Helianthus annuus]
MQTHEEYLESPWQRQLNFTSIGQSKANMEHLLNNKTLGILWSLHREEQVVVGFGFMNVIRTYNYFEITYYASAT